jgi:hypothetical protein
MIKECNMIYPTNIVGKYLYEQIFFLWKFFQEENVKGRVYQISNKNSKKVRNCFD